MYEEFKEEVLKSLAQGVTIKHDDCFWQNYNVFSSVINSEFGQIQEDMRDIGLYDNKDNWQFYLSKYELEYIGLGDELDKMQHQYDIENLLVRVDEGGESLVDELIADVVKRSKESEISKGIGIELEIEGKQEL